jgi:hypothetical protein
VSKIRLVADQHDSEVVVAIRQFPHFFQPAHEMAKGLPPVRRESAERK